MEPQPIAIYTSYEEYIAFFFQSTVGKISVMFLLIGWLVYSKYISMGDWQTIRYTIQKVESTKGVINASETLRLRIKDQVVTRTYFSYEVAGNLYFGDAFLVGTFLENGQLATVEYLVNEPYTSRISGTRNAPYGPIVLLWWIVPLLGLICFVWTSRKVFRTTKLLNHGYLKTGVRIKQGIIEKASFLPWVKISYEYRHGNSSYIYHKWTTQSLNYREKETIIFIDGTPPNAMLCKDFSKYIVESIERLHAISLEK